ncbi:MAG: RNB domain-containing ribonuclease [Myxococcales bacterium]|nr:RNB domain-containing ribonuclease [Myxococcales bacterium]
MAESGRGGRIVDLVEPGRERLELAWVREETKGKARLRTAGGREHTLSSRALDDALVADHGPAGHDPPAALARRAAEIETARAALAPEELELLWEATAADDDHRRPLADLAAELFGAGASPTRVSALGRALESDGDRFALAPRAAAFTVFGRRTRQARRRRAEEACRAREEEERRDAALATEARRIAALARPLLDGSSDAWPAELDPFLDRLLDAARLDRERFDEPPGEEGRIVWAVADALALDGEAPPPRHLADRLLRVRHHGASRTFRTRRILGLDPTFPAGVESAAREEPADPLAALREDLGGLPALAIDDTWTRLRDDALAVIEERGVLEVYVLIADGAAAIPHDGPIDRDARRRAVTHYWPDGIVPMVPPALAEERLSLDADGRPRNVLAAHFRCAGGPDAPRLELLRLLPARVRIAANRSYDEVDTALREPRTPDDDRLARLWTCLAAVRRARGVPAEPPRPEVRLVVEGDGARIEIRELLAGTPARRLVEELALATGMAAARRALESGTPLVYRVQDAPSDDRGPRRATYTLTPDPHHAMGGALYAHVTSPLRRYADLLNQRQILARLSGGALPPVPQVELQRVTLALRDVLDRARDLERDAHRYWALRWLAARPGEILDAELRLDPQFLGGARSPRALVRPVAVLLPVEPAEEVLDRAHAAMGRRDPGGAPPAALALRVRVEVRDAEALAARAVLAET